MLLMGGLHPDTGDPSSSLSCHCIAAEVSNAEWNGMSGPEPQLTKYVKVCVLLRVCVCGGWGKYLQTDAK